MPTVASFIEEAEAALLAGDAAQAVTVCRHLLNYCPKHIEANCLLAEALRDLGEMVQARELYLRVVSADPANVIAHWALGLIAEANQDSEWATWELYRAWESRPDNQELRKDLQRLTGAKPSPTPLSLALAYLAGGLFDKAIAELERLLADEPERLDARVILAESLWRAGRRDEAARVCEVILADSPDCLKANLLLGSWLASSVSDGDEDARGQTLLKRARELDPSGATATNLLAGEVPDGLTAEWPDIPAPQTADPATEAPPDEVEQLAATLATASNGYEVSSGQLPSQPPSSSLPGSEVARWLRATGEGSPVQRALEAHLAQQEAEPPPPVERRAIGDLDPGWQALLEQDITLDQESEDRLNQALAEIGLAQSEQSDPDWLEVPTVSSESRPRLADVARERASGGPDESSEIASRPKPPTTKRNSRSRSASAGPSAGAIRADLERAAGLWRDGNAEQALDVYRQLLIGGPEVAEEVVAGLRGLIQANPDLAAAHRVLGDAYMRAGRFQQAIDEYNWVLANRPTARGSAG